MVSMSGGWETKGGIKHQDRRVVTSDEEVKGDQTGSIPAIEGEGSGLSVTWCKRTST